jgi:hypothetical protein
MSSRSALKTVTPKPVVVKTVPVEVAPKPVAAPVEQIKRSESTISVASESKTRRHLTSVLDINISQARCHRHLKQNLSDATVTQEINSLRETLKDNTKVVEVAKINSQIKDLTRKQRDTKNVAEKAKIQAQINGLMNTLQTNAELKTVVDTTLRINELNKKIIRLSSEVSVVVATVCDFMVEDIVTFGLEHVLSNKKKQVQPYHLVEAGVENIKSYPLIRNLSVFLTEKAKLDKPKTETVEGATTEDSETEADDTDVNNNNFVTYVNNAIIKVKSNEKYAPTRITKGVRKYLSNLIICFIKRISNIAQIIVQDITDVRTLNPEHVVNIMKWILKDEQACDSIFEEIKTKVEEKRQLYKQHCSTMKTIEESSEEA